METPGLAKAGQSQTVKLAVLTPESGSQKKLDPGGFEVWVNSEKSAVTSVVSPGEDLVLLIVMDVTGDLSRIDTARQALVQEMKRFGRREYLSILRAQDGLQVVQDPTRDRKKLRESILNLPVSGFPGLLDAVEPASGIADSMLQQSDVRVAVLFITDGSIYGYRGDYTSPVINPSDSSDLSRRFRDRLIQEKISGVLASLNASMAPLFFLHLESRADALNAVYENGIQQFAQATAGEAIFCRSVAEIPTQIRSLLDRIRSVYTLTVRDAVSPGRLRLEVRHPGGTELIHRDHLEVKPD